MERLRKAAEAATLPPPPPLSSTPVHARIPDAAPARARARIPLPPTTRAPTAGPAVRGAIDDSAARVVRSLAQAIRPGMRLRLSRTRPTWAAGFLEDYPVSEGDSLATFFEHVRDEYGGQSYTVEVLAAGDLQAFEGALQVAGPPLERGRPINRNKWEGRDEEPAIRAVTPPAPPVAPALNLSGIVDLAALVLGAFQKHQSEQMSSVKEMVSQSRELVVAALGQRDKQEQRTSFAAQLGEIVDATRSLDKVKRAIAGPTPPARSSDDEDDDAALMSRTAKKLFFEAVGSGLIKKVMPTEGLSTAPAQARPRLQSARKPHGFIPDARSAGQVQPKN